MEQLRSMDDSWRRRRSTVSRQEYLLMTRDVDRRDGADGEKISSADSGIEAGNDSTDSNVAQMGFDFVSGLKIFFDRTEGRSNDEYQLAMMSPSQTETSSARSVSPECTANSIDQPRSSLSSDSMDDSNVPGRNDRALVLSVVPEKFKLLRQQYGEREIRPIVRRMYSFMGPRHGGNKQELYGIRKAHLERRMRIAAATNNVEGVKSVLRMGVSPNNSDQQGRTPLHLASGRGYMEIVDLLLKYGADAKRRDCIGNSPLHLATVTSNICVVTLLLEAGADPLSADNHGYNPLQLANTKLRLLKNCNSDDMVTGKSAVQSVINMLSAYLRNRDGFGEQVEALSSICSRLSLSNTPDQLKNDVENLLTNIDYLQLNS